MAMNYNPRSDSSASRKTNTYRKKPSPSSPKRSSSGSSSSSFSRNKVEYIQSAKTDLASKTSEKDNRMRYARYRSDKTIRVLGEPSQSRSHEKHQVPPGYDDEEPKSGRRRSAGSSTVTGVTVREHRQRAMQQRRSKAPGRIALVVIVLIVLVIIGAGVYFSPAFTVQTVKVEGAHRLTNERLSGLAAVPAGSTLLRLDTEGIQDRVASDPWIESVEVQRSFPSTVVLLVTERQIAAVVDLPSPSSTSQIDSWLISNDGVWLGSFQESIALTTGGSAQGTDGAGANTEQTDATDETATDEEAEKAPVAGSSVNNTSLLDDVLVMRSEVQELVFVKDASRSIVPVIGQTVTDGGVLNALALLKGFSPEMLTLVQSISAPDAINTTLELTNHVGVAFGAAEDIQAKEKVILQLLADHEGFITYINVRVADRATYRAAD
jgi:cell division protein FtsQ